jgi:hypothetical protein
MGHWDMFNGEVHADWLTWQTAMCHFYKNKVIL